MSEHLPERRGSSAVPNGHLRAADADRDQVATLLSTAYAEGRLTRDEHDERLDRAMQAKTFDDLVPLTADLVPAPSTQPPAPTPSPDQTWALDTTNTTDEPEHLIAVFGGTTRKGRWRVRRQTYSWAVFGGADLDLREAVFESPRIEVGGFWCFGGLDLKVPPGTQVIDQTGAIFGGTDIKDLGDPDPNAPVIVLKGLSLFGGVSVRGPKPPKKRTR